MEKLSHVDQRGRPAMVDVSQKTPVRRIARARGVIKLSDKTIALIEGKAVAKGDVLALAEFAGIQAAKRTPELIPLCHPLLLDHVAVHTNLGKEGVTVESEVVCVGRTGVEMEALTAVNIALLTIYDMCKAVDSGMIMGEVQLLEKLKKPI